MALRTARIIAAASAPKDGNEHRTVNIVTATNPIFETCLQVTGAQTNEIPTYIAAAATVAGLKTICIVGYAAPG